MGPGLASPCNTTAMHFSLPDNYRRGQRLQTLVENQTTYTVAQAEMSIFETHQMAERVMLTFDAPVLASMVHGKKVMHLRDQKAFPFLPGESLVLPGGEPMCIDFPEASVDTPTKCLAMTIDPDLIGQVVARMNEELPKADGAIWNAWSNNYCFTNDAAIHRIIHRMIYLFAEDHPSKDLFVGMALQELLVRILQAESRDDLLIGKARSGPSDRLTHVVQHIRDNLREKLSVEDLCRVGNMSASHFTRTFKSETGMSPIDFINEQRLQMAAGLLRDKSRRIGEVYLECGFNSPSYFNRQFKRRFGSSPKAFQQGR